MARNALAAPAAIRELARFRYELRRFLRFSEKAARKAGLTPQQHQLLLGVAGHTGRGWATVSELAEFLQERHNAVVGLVDRALRAGLVSKEPVSRDHRLVRVQLTARGRRMLDTLSALHRRELRRFQVLSDLFFHPPADGKDIRTPRQPKRPMSQFSSIR
ncbi:MAG TPA: MarR family transcriptional regulator [Patescibacteria group bacterium]|nr:MarR family transcriptional regulator [Patescibacteria group bacterium]